VYLTAQDNWFVEAVIYPVSDKRSRTRFAEMLWRLKEYSSVLGRKRRAGKIFNRFADIRLMMPMNV
jgi:hypothetical protein